MKKMGMKANPTKLGNKYISKISKLDKRIVILERYSIILKARIGNIYNKNIINKLKMFEKFSPMKIVHLKFSR